MARYGSRVAVQFNPNTYANEKVIMDWITDMLVLALPAGPRLLALDVAKFHKTDDVLDTLHSYAIIPAMIPPGCTSLMQPLDISVNKPLKDILRNLTEDSLVLFEQQTGEYLRETGRASTVEDRRVLIQKCVAEAWHQFCTAKRDIIVNSSRKVGLSLPIDGSCDEELSTKGIGSEQLVAGDWRLKPGEPEQEIEGWGIPGGPGDEDNRERDELPVEREIDEDGDNEDETEFVDRD